MLYSRITLGDLLKKVDFGNACGTKSLFLITYFSAYTALSKKHISGGLPVSQHEIQHEIQYPIKLQSLAIISAPSQRISPHYVPTCSPV